MLKRLEELRILERVELISTVSGGSITGALYALRCAQCGGRPGSSPVDSLIDEMRPLVTSNLRGQALLGDPLRALRTATSFAVPWVTRMPLGAGELDRRLFGGARVADLPPWNVLNLTNLATGKAWKFLGRGRGLRGRRGDGATDRHLHLLLTKSGSARTRGGGRE